MLRILILLTFAIISYLPKARAFDSKNEVDIVFCMDMSGSTNGLIPDFKNKIWEVINGVYKLRPYPRVKIGIIGFSRPSFGKNDGYVKVLCDFTENYDQFVFELNQLKPAVEKGDQFVGAALQAAGKMNWSKEPKALRIIYLMGNGMVSSGGYDYRKTCEDLLRKNISINSIYCIQQKLITREIPGWKSISDNTGGAFFTYKICNVSPLQRVSADAQTLLNLNNKLNSTYIYYGPQGKAKMQAMREADRSSLQMGENYFYPRVFYKASDHFQSNNSDWDLVNFVKTSGTKLDNLDPKLMADSIKLKEKPEILKLILKAKDERTQVVLQIRSYMTSIGFDTIQPGENQLQGIILNSVNKLARDKGFFN